MAIFIAAAALTACSPGRSRPSADMTHTEDIFAARRAALVRDHLALEIRDPRVLDAMMKVPRHRFVPPELWSMAYDDRPLPIGHDVTISQPYVVALMSQLAEVSVGERVLEVGTGSGYQAAVLAELGAEVFTIERIEALAISAEGLLHELGYTHVRVRFGDGYAGWPEAAPFDAVIVTAAPPEIPEALLQQLAVGGRLVAPIGPSIDDTSVQDRVAQKLVVVERTETGFVRHVTGDVAFVPMLPGTTR